MKKRYAIIKFKNQAKKLCNIFIIDKYVLFYFFKFIEIFNKNILFY